MRRVMAVIALALAAAAGADELTVAEVVAAQRAGAPVEGIVRLVREAAAVVTLAPADLARLRAASVPEQVIQAMVARTAPPQPTAAPARPADPRLLDVVRLVRAGVSDPLLCEQIRRSGARYRPTTNDIVYLKESRVSDEVIAALLESGSPPAPTATETAPPPAPPTPAPTVPAPRAAAPDQAGAAPLAFGPLVRMTGVFRKGQSGRLVLTGDRLDWSGEHDPGSVESTPVRALRAVWLAAVPRNQAAALVELRVRTTSGAELTFRDAGEPGDGGSQVVALHDAMRARFPSLVLPDAPAR